MKAIKLSLSAYLILNLLYFGFQRIDVDPYSNVTFNETDPIYSEYFELAQPLNNKGIIPSNRFITVFNNKVETYFTLSNIITDSISKSTNQGNTNYIKTINKNIEHIDAMKGQLKFRRNKYAASLWLDYLEVLKAEAEFKFEDITQIKDLKLKPMDLQNLGDLGVKSYLMQTDIGGIISKQIPLKSYHNSTILNHQNSSITSEITDRIMFFVGYVLDYVIGDLILKEGEPRPYKEVFLKME